MALDLDIWTVEKLSGYFGGRPDVAGISLREAIDKYTAEKLAETVKYAKANSDFYREKIEDFTEEDSLFTDIPFTTAEELRENGVAMLCVSPEECPVSEDTAGTTGEPKKLFFTKEDHRLNGEYFSRGLRLVADETDRLLILLPVSSDGSLGRFIAQGLDGFGGKAIEYGTPFTNSDRKATEECREILQLIRDEKITGVVASPTHMISLARQAEKEMASGKDEIYLRSILLCGEFVPDQTAMMLEDVFQCMVFEHYGMTETGQGCGISCGYSRGYHIRECDLFIELINPMTGQVVEETSNRNTPGFSNYGEIVVTTLTREGMPLIRYRTGDFSRWVLGDCPCGSTLKRLDKIVPGDGRVEEQMRKNNG